MTPTILASDRRHTDQQPVVGKASGLVDEASLEPSSDSMGLSLRYAATRVRAACRFSLPRMH